MGAEQALGGRPARWARYRVILYFLLGLFMLDRVVAGQRRLWRSYDPDEYRERIHDCRRRPRDLIVLGGSPVCEGINPAAVSGLHWQGRPLEHVYNLGLPGATTTEVWHAAEHGIATPPRLLVYGITASDLNDSRDEPHGPRVLMDTHDVAVSMRARPDTATWCLRQFVEGRLTSAWCLFHYRNGIRLWSVDRIDHLCPGLSPTAAAEAREGLRTSATLGEENGYCPRPQFVNGRLDVLKAAQVRFDRFPYLENYRLGGHLAYLHRLMDWAESQGVSLVLVDMPVSADLENGMHPEAFAAYRAALAEIERTRGVYVLRASREATSLTDADFADLIHLNASGAARLSRWLREMLDHGGPP